MKYLITIVSIALFSTTTLYGQSGTKYHVNIETLNLHTSASEGSGVIRKMKKYDNLILLGKIKRKNRVKVQYKDLQGYVSTQFIQKGEAVFTVQSVRVGARCKDGSSSKATGRGACSRHGGVKEWKMEEKKTVSIIINN
ncbi:MAG: hypothetical protein HEP71_33425 [Roseivirga sp.]|nr:hypothetical protein [Roseivirga sp.]